MTPGDPCWPGGHAASVSSQIIIVCHQRKKTERCCWLRRRSSAAVLCFISASETNPGRGNEVVSQWQLFCLLVASQQRCIKLIYCCCVSSKVASGTSERRNSVQLHKKRDHCTFFSYCVSQNTPSLMSPLCYTASQLTTVEQCC